MSYEGTPLADTHTFTGFTDGDTFDGLGGEDTLDASATSTGFLFDLSSGIIGFPNPTSPGTATLQNFEVVLAGSGDDRLHAMNGMASTLHGGLGDDTLVLADEGLTENTHFIGGAGFDILDLSHLTGRYVVSLYDGFLADGYGGGEEGFVDGIEGILGSQGNDVFNLGLSATTPHTIYANAGDDTIVALATDLADSTVLDGGSGLNRLFFSSFTGDYSLNMATGFFQSADGTVTATASGFFSVYASAGNDLIGGTLNDDVILSGFGNDTVAGNAGDDWIEGLDGMDLLRGGDGNDSVEGGDGDDRLFGDAGNDQLDGDAGNDTIVGGAGNDGVRGGLGDDAIAGNQGNDFLVGDEGADRLWGEAGFDTLYGGSGNDWQHGGTQADNLYGLAGNDTLLGGVGYDRLFGGLGDDQLFGGTQGDVLFGMAGRDTLYGQSGGDRLYGGGGNDLVDGGTGDDQLFGGGGFDTLVGSTGDDMLTGDESADTFVFADFGGGFGADTITDFDAGNVFEQIDLSRVAAITNLFDLFANHIRQIGADVVIDAGGANTIAILNTDLSDLDRSDFIF